MLSHGFFVVAMLSSLFIQVLSSTVLIFHEFVRACTCLPKASKHHFTEFFSPFLPHHSIRIRNAKMYWDLCEWNGMEMNVKNEFQSSDNKNLFCIKLFVCSIFQTRVQMSQRILKHLLEEEWMEMHMTELKLNWKWRKCITCNAFRCFSISQFLLWVVDSLFSFFHSYLFFTLAYSFSFSLTVPFNLTIRFPFSFQDSLSSIFLAHIVCISVEKKKQQYTR